MVVINTGRILVRCFVVVAALTLLGVRGGYSIVEFGAVANDTSYNASVANGKALFDAMQAAALLNETDREVLVPAGETFTYLPYAVVHGVHGVTLTIAGTLNAFPGDMSLWPNNTRNGAALNILQFDECDHLTITGSGHIYGNGYRWWWYVLLTGNDNRPHTLVVNSCTNFLLENLTLYDSPQYHVLLEDTVNATIQYVRVHVDVTEQMGLFQEFHVIEDGLPVFPLNTDGIDVAGRNITVRHCHVENFDDSVCIKPSNGRNNLTQCSEDMHVHDIVIHNGVGASVGSVPPDLAVNCIRNILFERITFYHPIKALYVKPNPCPNGAEIDGTGVIDNITYQDIHANMPLWWSIWVSTQQQQQPGNGTDTGCSFFFPLPGTTCPTQPCVPVTRLTIRNFTAIDALLSPGVLRCNASNPCRNFLFDNVVIGSDTGFPFGQDYLCEAIDNFTIIGASAPVQCVYNATLYEDASRHEHVVATRRRVLGIK